MLSGEPPDACDDALLKPMKTACTSRRGKRRLEFHPYPTFKSLISNEAGEIVRLISETARIYKNL